MKSVELANRTKRALEKYRIPKYMHPGIIDYVSRGIVPGGFLVAILTNDLYGAVMRADANNRNLIEDYVLFFNNEVPAASWGSMDKVKQWRWKMSSRSPEIDPGDIEELQEVTGETSKVCEEALEQCGNLLDAAQYVRENYHQNG